MEIEGKKIGPGCPTYVIAEIGINHNGRPETAFELVDAAIDAQADAVKFQKRHLPSIYSEDVLSTPEKYEQGLQYMIPLLKKVELSDDTYLELKNYCDERGITFICTPFDTVSADFLDNINTPAFKIASADLTNDVLIRHIARFNKPMILSTGMSSWEEIGYTAELLNTTNVPYAFLHCRSVYPVWPREVNLRMINKLREFGVPVGYSGHEIGITIALVAASMGAEIIEKHITLDRKQEGPDHKASLEPYEFKRLIRDIRLADQALGKEKRYLLRGEVMNRELFGKSLVASQPIAPGTVIDESMISVTGPAKGLPPYRRREIIGRKAGRALQAGDYFTEKDLGKVDKEDFSRAFSSEWGLIARFTDYHKMLKYEPKVIEFHLAEKDFQIPFEPEKKIDCKLVVHCPEYIGEHLMDLCCFNEDIRKKSVQLVKSTITLTNQIADYFKGKPKIIIHPGAMSLQAKLDIQKLEDSLVRSIDEINDDDGIGSVDLLLENMPPYPWYFGGQWKGNYFMDSAEIIRFCEKYNISICFDLSHAALYCNAKEKDLAAEIKALLPYAKHLHLADGYGLDGEGVQFGEGDIELEEILPLFSGYSGTWVPEIWRGHLDDGQGFLDALRFLEAWLE